MPNPGSRALGLAVRLARALGGAPRIPSLLAETFTDIETFEGTCYKAAGWDPCIDQRIIRGPECERRSESPANRTV